MTRTSEGPESARPLGVAEAQADVRRIYHGGWLGPLVAAVVWLVAGLAADRAGMASGSAVLFLGGWGVPFAWFGWDGLGEVDDWMNIGGPLILFTKMLLLSFIIMWVRFSWPRFREDQLQRFAWKFLIPISLLNILVTMTLKVAF